MNSTKHSVARKSLPGKTIRPRTKPLPCRPNLGNKTQRNQESGREGKSGTPAPTAATAAEHAADALGPANRPTKKLKTIANDPSPSNPSLPGSFTSRRANSVRNEETVPTRARTTSKSTPTTTQPASTSEAVEMEARTETIETLPNQEVAQKTPERPELRHRSCVIL